MTRIALIPQVPLDIALVGLGAPSLAGEIPHTFIALIGQLHAYYFHAVRLDKGSTAQEKVL